MKFDKARSLENQELVIDQSVTVAQKITLTRMGVLAVNKNAFRKEAVAKYDITAIRGYVSKAPEGKDIIIDVHVNSTVMAKLKIPKDKKITEAFGFLPTTVEKGSVLHFSIVQVGSTFAGENLLIEYAVADSTENKKSIWTADKTRISGHEGARTVEIGEPAGWNIDLAYNAIAYSNLETQRPLLVKDEGVESLKFDGVDDYLMIHTNRIPLVFLGESRTIEFWYKSKSSDLSTDIPWAIVSSDNTFLIGATSGKKAIGFLLYDITYGWSNQEYSNHLQWNQSDIDFSIWHHIACIYDFVQKSIRIHIDGELLYNKPLPTGFTARSNIQNQNHPQYDTLAQYTHLGHRQISPIGVNHNPCWLRQFRMWRIALTTQQIKDGINKKFVGNEQYLIFCSPF